MRLELAPELVRKLLEEYRHRFEAGRRSELFAALRFCMRQEILAPAWAAQAFFDATNAWYSMRAKTLDEAFGVAWPKGKSFEAARRKKELYLEVFNQIHEADQLGRPIDDELFEEIGEPLGIGKTLVKEYYSAAKSLVDRPSRAVRPQKQRK